MSKKTMIVGMVLATAIIFSSGGVVVARNGNAASMEANPQTNGNG